MCSCSVLQCVAVYCNELQCVAVCVAVCCSVFWLQCVLQCVAVCSIEDQRSTEDRWSTEGLQNV